MILFAIVHVLVVALLIEIVSAPCGYEDETGFHYEKQS